MSQGDVSKIVHGLRKLARQLVVHARDRQRAGNEADALELIDEAAQLQTIADGWDNGPRRSSAQVRTGNTAPRAAQDSSSLSHTRR